MAGLVPAIHALLPCYHRKERRGCPAQGRAWRRGWRAEIRL